MKKHIKQIEEYIDLYIDNKTGIVWVENGSTGNRHSAHPNIDASGSIKGMKSRGYWGKDDITVTSNGFIYNISKMVITDEYDQIAKDHCKCSGCLPK